MGRRGSGQTNRTNRSPPRPAAARNHSGENSATSRRVSGRVRAPLRRLVPPSPPSSVFTRKGRYRAGRSRDPNRMYICDPGPREKFIRAGFQITTDVYSRIEPTERAVGEDEGVGRETNMPPGLERGRTTNERLIELLEWDRGKWRNLNDGRVMNLYLRELQRLVRVQHNEHSMYIHPRIVAFQSEQKKVNWRGYLADYDAYDVFRQFFRASKSRQGARTGVPSTWIGVFYTPQGTWVRDPNRTKMT